MANSNTKRIVRDGFRNAVVELVGVLDTAAVSIITAPAIALADFTSNDPGFTRLTGFRVDAIRYSISDTLTAMLFWQATTQQPIAAISGRDTLDFKRDAGLQPASAAAGYTGEINLEVYNVTAAGGTKQGYTITLELVKLYAA